MMLTVAFFGSGGEGSMVPLDAASKCHRVLAVVRPGKARSGFGRAIRSLPSRSGLTGQAVRTKWARMHDVPLLDAGAGRDPHSVERSEKLGPDAACLSALPRSPGRE